MSNTDDHLRNHGFLLDAESGAWRLSPLFDVNPSLANRQYLSLALDDGDYEASFETLGRTAPLYCIEESEARAIIERIDDTVKTHWRRGADEAGLSRGEIKLMEACFSAPSLRPLRKGRAARCNEPRYRRDAKHAASIQAEQIKRLEHQNNIKDAAGAAYGPSAPAAR